MLLTILLQGVPWAGVRSLKITAVLILAVMALLSFVILAHKYITLGRARRAGRTYVKQVAKTLRNLKWDASFKLTEEYSKQTYLAETVLVGFKEWQALKGQLPDDVVFRHMARAMERHIIESHLRHEANLGIIDAISATAPFIGALGGSAGTFAFGIALAVPFRWAVTNLRNKTSLLEAEMKNAASEISVFIEMKAINPEASWSRTAEQIVGPERGERVSQVD